MLYPKGTTVSLVTQNNVVVKLTGVSGSITIPKSYTLEVLFPVPQPPPPPPPPPVTTATLYFEPSSVTVGSLVHVKGANWGANTRIYGAFMETNISGQATSIGTLDMTFGLNPTTKPGPYPMTVTSLDGLQTATATLMIT